MKKAIKIIGLGAAGLFGAFVLLIAVGFVGMSLDEDYVPPSERAAEVEQTEPATPEPKPEPEPAPAKEAPEPEPEPEPTTAAPEPAPEKPAPEPEKAPEPAATPPAACADSYQEPETPLAEVIYASELPDTMQVVMVQEVSPHSDSLYPDRNDVLVYLCTEDMTDEEHRAVATVLATAADAEGTEIGGFYVKEFTPGPDGLEEGDTLHVENFENYLWGGEYAVDPDTRWTDPLTTD